MKRLRGILQWLLGNPGARRGLAGASAAFVLCLAGRAWAAGGHGGGEAHLNWWTWDQHAPPVGWFIVDFVLFVGLLVFLTKKPVAAMFQKRHVTIKQSIDEAQSAFARAQAHYGEYHDKLARVEQEIVALVHGAKDDGIAERERIVQAARDYAERLKKDAESTVGQELRDSELRLRFETVNRIISSAESMLRRELGKDDQVRLLEASLRELENGGTPRPPADARSRPEAVA